MPRLLTLLIAVVLSSVAPSVAADEAQPPSLEIVLAAQGDLQAGPHGEGNIYAPEVMLEPDHARMWFGGQGRDGHDRIFLAESADGVAWQQRGVVLEDPAANHVNDPSVVRTGDQYFMYYTLARKDVRDEIAVATFKRSVLLSKDQGKTWKRIAENGAAHG